VTLSKSMTVATLVMAGRRRSWEAAPRRIARPDRGRPSSANCRELCRTDGILDRCATRLLPALAESGSRHRAGVSLTLGRRAEDVGKATDGAFHREGSGPASRAADVTR